jgi:hypothetical protein
MPHCVFKQASTTVTNIGIGIPFCITPFAAVLQLKIIRGGGVAKIINHKILVSSKESEEQKID